MKALVTGGRGLLGCDVVNQLESAGWEVDIIDLAGPEQEHVDICDADALLRRARQVGPDAVVHCAAWTEVDACESDPDRAFRLNALGARNVAIAARRVGAKLLHVSTDYVFEGSKSVPYTESDSVGPLSVYGVSKEAGERMVREQCADHFILRIAWLYGERGASFPANIARFARQFAAEGKPLRVVDDQRGSPTWSREVARQIARLLPTEAFGTLHGTAAGDTTWYGFTRVIVETLGIEVEVQPCTTEEFPRPAPRPANSVLDNRALRVQGLDVMQGWEAAWREYVAEGGVRTVNSEP